MRPIKRFLKGILAKFVLLLGNRGFWDTRRSLLLHSVSPRLLDPAVIPRVSVERLLRDGNISILCNPYGGIHHTIPYWTGRLFETGTERVLRAVLRKGDTFIDVGANYGHMTALGAGLVGENGAVYAFEPTPDLAQLLTDFVRRRGLVWVTVEQTALSDRAGEQALFIGHAGSGGENTLRDLDKNDFKAEPITVRLAKGDDVLADKPCPGRTIVKIDVEGSEPEVLDGMESLLRDTVEAAVVEVTPEWIGGQAGVEKMFARMQALGFQAHAIEHSPSETRPRLCGPASLTEQTDVLFVKPSLALDLGLTQEVLDVECL